MNLDDRLKPARTSLDRATANANLDLAGLDLRERSRKRRSRSAAAVVLLTALSSLVLVTGNRTGEPVASNGGASGGTLSGPVLEPVNPTGGTAFTFSRIPDGFEIVLPETVAVDQGDAFAGEEYVKLYVRFGEQQDRLSSHDGAVAATIRVGFGEYDDQIHEVFPGPGTPITIGGRAFELVEVDRATFRQTTLVPVDTSERTFLVTGRNIDPAVLVAVVESIELTDSSIPIIGFHAEDFVVIHSGRSEFASLSLGTAVTYGETDGPGAITVATYDGVAISCFAYAWVHPNTELSPLGGDTGVIAQLAGQPGAVGTYTALWNLDDDTLISITVSGFDRTALIEFADQLEFADAPLEAYQVDIAFPF